MRRLGKSVCIVRCPFCAGLSPGVHGRTRHHSREQGVCHERHTTRRLFPARSPRQARPTRPVSSTREDSPVHLAASWYHAPQRLTRCEGEVRPWRRTRGGPWVCVTESRAEGGAPVPDTCRCRQPAPTVSGRAPQRPTARTCVRRWNRRPGPMAHAGPSGWPRRRPASARRSAGGFPVLRDRFGISRRSV